MRSFLASACFALLLTNVACLQAADDQAPAVGKTIENFSLGDVRGKQHALADW